MLEYLFWKNYIVFDHNFLMFLIEFRKQKKLFTAVSSLRLKSFVLPIKFYRCSNKTVVIYFHTQLYLTFVQYLNYHIFKES